MGQGRGRAPLGGILSLVALIGEHTDAIRADLHRFHGVRLTEIGWRVTWAEVKAFLAHLPPEAALWRALDSPRQWGYPELLLAAIEHRLSSGNWQRGNGKGKRPKPIPAPGTNTANTRRVGTAMPVDEMRRVLDEWGQRGVTDGD